MYNLLRNIILLVLLASFGAFANDSGLRSLERINQLTNGQAEQMPQAWFNPQQDMQVLRLGSELGLKLSDTQAPLKISQRKQHSQGVTSLVAKSDVTDDRAIITQYGDVTMARITLDGKAWTYVQYPDVSYRYPSDALPLKFHDDVIEPENGIDKLPRPSEDDGTPLPEGEMATIDIYATYTPAGVEDLGKDGVIAKIANLIDVTNQIYRDSGVFIEANLLTAELVDYDPENERDSSGTLSDYGYGDVFAGSRFDARERGADFKVIFKPLVDGDDACGIAYGGGFPNQGGRFKARRMFSHVAYDCGDSTLAHELGHNMGLTHAQRQDGDGYSYYFARGYGVDDEFVTVMAYGSAFNASEIPVFSSPELDCDGLPCGVDRNQSDGADAVYALNSLRHLMMDIGQRSGAKDGIAAVATVNGGGYIEASSSSLNCGATSICGGYVPRADTVRLEAIAIPGETFEGWGGACEAFGQEPICDVSTDLVTSVSANFTQTFPVGSKLDKSRLHSAINGVNDSDTVFLTTDFTGFSLFDTLDPFWSVVEGDRLQGADVIRSPLLYLLKDFTQEQDFSHDLSFISAGGPGELSFWAKLDAVQGETASFTIAGEELAIEANTGWQRYEVPLAEDYSALRYLSFNYYDRASGGTGYNGLLLDDIHFERSDDNKVGVLKVNIEGSGKVTHEAIEGYVTSPSCVDDCVMYFRDEALVSITPKPDKEKSFVGWGGDCQGQSLTCEISVTDDTEITAIFDDAESVVAGDLAEWLDNDKLLFNMTSSADSAAFWKADRSNARAGNESAKAIYTVEDPGYVSITTQLKGPGTLSFDWYTNEPNDVFDFVGSLLSLWVNNEPIVWIGPEQDWVTEEIELGEGEHFVEWRMEKSFGGEPLFTGSANIDNVQWTGTTPRPVSRLTLSATEGGSISGGNGIYCDTTCEVQVAEQPLSLQAAAQADYRFSHWEGACSGSEPICNVEPSKAVSVTAIFEEYRGEEVSSRVSGNGFLSPDTLYLMPNEVGYFEVSPILGNSLSAITGCGGELKGSRYHVGPITEPCTVNAEFEQNQYRVEFSLGDYGQYAGGGALQQAVPHGAAAEAPELTVTDGWHFAGWNESLQKVTSNRSIEAMYQRIDDGVRVDLVLQEGGTTPLSTVQFVPTGDYLTVPINPLKGYYLNQKVSGNCPAGEWENKTQYRFGPINSNCTVAFEFNSASEQSGGALILIMAVEAAKKGKQE